MATNTIEMQAVCWGIFVWISDGIWYGSGWLLAGWILSSVIRDNLNWIIWHCYAVFSLVLSTYLCIVPASLRTYVPSYIMYNSPHYWLLHYLRRSSNLLTYLLTYIHTNVLIYVPMYQLTYVPTYLRTYVPMYLCTYIPTYLYYLRSFFFGIIYVPMYSTCLPT